MTKEDFISEAMQKYGDKYDYSLLPSTIRKKEKVPIICNEHGIFYKDFQHFIDRGNGCNLCSSRKRYTISEFIELCKTLPHIKECSFEKTTYRKNTEKVIITCHHKDKNGNEHGDFLITPSHLKTGEGCPKCRYIKSSSGKRRDIDEVKKLAADTHNGKYDYSLITEYKNDRTKYPIICPEHGTFFQTFNNHINAKQGCPICGREKCDNERRITNEEFIERAATVHDGKYDYSKTNYIESKKNVTIICPTHGEFQQIARNHLFGAGCPKCFREKSTIEKELFDFISSIEGKENVIENDRIILKGKEIDVYIPAKKIGFEMNGVIWHSEKFNGNNKNYHLSKTIEAEKKGIRLIHIFEDEWLAKKDICKSRIKNILGVTEKKIYARNCLVREITDKEAKDFINANHIQGWTFAKIKFGAFYNNELVSVMTFGKQRINLNSKRIEGEYELIRFSNRINTSVIGIAGKMLKFFIKKYNPIKIVSYADRRWSNGNLYEKIGFKNEGSTPPSYSYVINHKRINRFSLRKDILVSKYGCPKNVTEKSFCESNGWYRIYDCGTLKYVWKKEN